MIKAMKQSLDVLDKIWNSRLPLHNVDDIKKARTSLNQAIKELESQEPVQDDHQAFIDSLPTDNDDKMFMQIDHWARKSYKRHQSLVRGQAVTTADAFESHIVWAALRWAKENTPPQRTKQEPEAWMYQEYRDDDQFGWRDEIQFVQPPNDPNYFRNIVPLYTHPPQRTLEKNT